MSNIYCPICGEQNNCMARKVEYGACWCNEEDAFPKGIFKLVPPESKGKHCICRSCLIKYREEVNS
ncbi:cysteine-rich CWC family protein [Salipaludibacillus sp. HK11]|uniref:cysteine-rich CWC family protein n=1 Tax=Salipaludibacillus sp. HK11 TaxID=3394320 RepID=UPI0039FBC89B